MGNVLLVSFFVAIYYVLKNNSDKQAVKKIVYIKLILKGCRDCDAWFNLGSSCIFVIVCCICLREQKDGDKPVETG